MQTVTPTLSWKSTKPGPLRHHHRGKRDPERQLLSASDGFDLDRSNRPGQDLDLGRGGAELTRGGAIAYAPVGPEHHARRRGQQGPSNRSTAGQIGSARPTSAAGVVPSNRVPAGQRERDLCGGRVRLGLYKSTNGGATWTNPISSRAVTSIAIDPSHTSVVYVGMAKYSSYADGLMKTTDGGTTWTTALANTEVSSVLVDPANSQRVYVGTTAGAVLRSQDGGTTWSNLSGTTIAAARGAWPSTRRTARISGPRPAARACSTPATAGPPGPLTTPV